jgi:hypothetical protein
MKTKAIVTLAIGEAFKKRWERLCGDNWWQYAQRHGSDLMILDQPIDRSARATRRSFAWQKCLILGAPAVKKYDQVVWFDCDIFFNPLDAPSVFDEVPIEKVGAVNSFEDPSFAENKVALERLWKSLRSLPDVPATGEYSTPQDVYLKYGPPVTPLPTMLNAGVLVASPRHHAEVWRDVYDNYDDRGNPSYYENVPLSYELVKRDLVHWLDPKFNHLWAWSKFLHYPFLENRNPRSFRDKILRRLAKYTGNNYEQRVAVACATAALLNCYCLHFAGYAVEMEWVDLKSAATGRVGHLGMR